MIFHRAPLVLFALILPLLVGLTIFGFFTHSQSMYAAPNGIIMVNTLQDENDGSCLDSDCSLRDAINTANNNDVINFDVAGTITLSSSLNTLNINKNLTINGGSVITVSGDDNVRIFNVTAGNVIFDGLIVTKGRAQSSDGCPGFSFADACGAGILIRNSGTFVTVTNAVFTDNRITTNEGSGAGIFNSNSSLTVENSTFFNNYADERGAAIFNRGGKTVIENSRFFENESFHGGSIYAWYAFGETTINSSSFYNNRGVECGGALYTYFGKVTVNNSTLAGNEGICGGAMRSFDAIVTINNSTISGNTGVNGGAFAINDGSFTIINSTISDNVATGTGEAGGGGALSIYNPADIGPSITIRNSTITSNTAPSLIGRDGIWYEAGTLMIENTIVTNNGSSNCTIDGASFNGSFHNMSDDDSCPDFTEVTDVMLGDLVDNGGDTLTHALLFGSPAINAGDCSGGPTVDQRGVTRPQNETCSIGAFEGYLALVYLPSILNEILTGMSPISIGNEIPQRPVQSPREVFYSTTIFVPKEIPMTGDFYLSSQPDILSAVLVDDEIVMKIDDSIVFTHDFSSSGHPQPANLSVPRVTMEAMAGKTITVEYLDVYSSFVEASEMWLIWLP